MIILAALLITTATANNCDKFKLDAYQVILNHHAKVEQTFTPSTRLEHDMFRDRSRMIVRPDNENWSRKMARRFANEWEWACRQNIYR